MPDPALKSFAPSARLLALARWSRRVLRSWIERARDGEYVFVLFTASLIGILGGLGAIAFEVAIHLFQDGFWGASEPAIEFLREVPKWKIALVPAFGGLLVGLVTNFFVSEAKGHGVPEVMKAVALRGGVIRGRVALAKILTSAVTIGSGGSAGREGPIIQIGAAIASRIGQSMGMSKRRLRTLVGCGAAAGIAATFNAPIAGALFAVEVVLGEFGAAQFGPIVVSSVVATVVARAYHGNVPAFSPPACTFASPWELVPYACLGILCGLVSLAYVRINHAAERFFDSPRLRLPLWSRPAVGGLLVGVLGIALPHVLGDGHWLANDAFASPGGVGLLLLLVFAKMVATGITLGSGGSGGVFSPALAVGALLGAALGGVAEPWFGARCGGVAAYALVGMGGLVAGSMLAPITAIVMVFEITSNYSIVLPVMFVSILSTVIVARRTGNLSIYTLKLAREGIRLFSGRSPDLLRARRVAEFLVPRFESISPDAPAQSLLDRMVSSEASQFYVVGPGGAFLGAVVLADARRILLSPPNLLGMLKAEDVMRAGVPLLEPGDSLSAALALFASSRLPELPVVDSHAGKILAGTISHSDVLSAYQEEILRADASQALSGGMASLGHQPVAVAPGFELVEWDPPASLHGKTLAEARLPDALGVRALIVKRPGPDGKTVAFLPDARTVVGPDDVFVLLGSSPSIARAAGK